LANKIVVTIIEARGCGVNFKYYHLPHHTSDNVFKMYTALSVNWILLEYDLDIVCKCLCVGVCVCMSGVMCTVCLHFLCYIALIVP